MYNGKNNIRKISTVILSVLCAILLCCSVGMIGGRKNEVKIAQASSLDFYDDVNKCVSSNAVESFATKIGFQNKKQMIAALKSGTVKNSSQLGTDTVTFGGKEWWPVYLSATATDIVLTLWAKDSIGSYIWADGTSVNGVTSPAVTNQYAFSYIHAFINAGQTSTKKYAGSFSGTSSVWYNTNESSNGQAAPTTFTQFVDFASGGKYSDCILPAGTVTFGSEINDVAYSDTNTYTTEWTADNLFLPSKEEAKSGGVWGLTATQWGSSSEEAWLRTGSEKYYTNAYKVNHGGGCSDCAFCGTMNSNGVRPA
ncbi:MAG: hypothetical protein K2K28_03060, partial [Clostridia bacterium]|nr:hypothetical protein [Clostridia bacterium]